MSEAHRSQMNLPGIDQRRTIDDMSAAEIDAKIAAAEARTDTKFAQLLGRLDVMNQKLTALDKSVSDLRGDNRSLRTLTVGSSIAVFFGIAATVLGALAYGGQLFSTGMNVSGIADAAAERAVNRVYPWNTLQIPDKTAPVPAQ